MGTGIEQGAGSDENGIDLSETQEYPSTDLAYQVMVSLGITEDSAYYDFLKNGLKEYEATKENPMDFKEFNKLIEMAIMAFLFSVSTNRAIYFLYLGSVFSVLDTQTTVQNNILKVSGIFELVGEEKLDGHLYKAEYFYTVMQGINKYLTLKIQ